MLKLAKLPDRTPVKIVITASPALNRDLAAYAEVYRQAYGSAESATDLIPFMLEAFLAGDRGFAQARKAETPASRDPHRARKHGSSATTNPTSEV
ncbi:MAG: DUF2274 domain-containing protein [Rhodopila sp.]|nr:DUF2274 domain-containing protein [Rhodopila sp.]